ncbi:MAG: hybrid sensor histidine kinase/response regulator [Bacteroidales bacterium]|nr:hybrid sensor histidine kinase/response regulator [Bacteroidales bacterium]
MEKKTMMERLLIVDDLPKNIQVLGKLLSGPNRQIAYALSGKEALRLTSENTFDLILLDIMMPEMDGFEVCTKLKKEKITADIPIIFLTAKTESEEIVRGFECGANDYITKPFNASELQARVTTQLELIRNKRQLQELNQNLEEKVTQRTLELRQANKQLAQLEKAKSDFLTIISHELRTPLNGIIGITSLLKQSIDDVEQKEYLDYLNNSSERLVRFAETALLITSLQFNNQQVELFDIDIENLFEMVVYELQAALDEKEIKVEIEVGKDARIVKGDSDLLQKSFCILAENAISHLPTGGRIWLSSSLTDGSLSLEVRDDGKGFSDEVLNRLQNFVTQDHITIEHGFGLSLAAVKLIIRAHNGRVILKNDDKGGAVVQLHFNC